MALRLPEGKEYQLKRYKERKRLELFDRLTDYLAITITILVLILTIKQMIGVHS